MTQEELQEKISSSKALQGKSIMDVLDMPLFAENMTKYMECQYEDRKKTRDSYKAMRKVGGKGKLPAHPIDKILGVEDMIPVQAFINEYAQVLTKTSSRPAEERHYIRQLGQQAWNKTIADIVCEEYPELKEIFFPQVKEN